MKDQISALMDDELDVESSPHLLKALEHDGGLRECWSTYHLIGDAMRGSMHLSPGLHARLMQQLEAEPTVLAPRRKTVMKPSFLMSAAASVAAVLFVGWMVLQQQVQSPAQEISAATIAQSNVSPESVNAYLLAHHELSPESGMQTAYYARPVAYTENGN